MGFHLIIIFPKDFTHSNKHESSQHILHWYLLFARRCDGMAHRYEYNTRHLFSLRLMQTNSIMDLQITIKENQIIQIPHTHITNIKREYTLYNGCVAGKSWIYSFNFWKHIYNRRMVCINRYNLTLLRKYVYGCGTWRYCIFRIFDLLMRFEELL